MWVFSFGARTRRRWAQVAAAVVLLGLVRWGLQRDSAGLATTATPAVLSHLQVDAHLVALTFALSGSTTDGQALETALAAENAPVTFFATARYAAAHAALMRTMVQNGDEVDALAGTGTPAPDRWAAAVGDATGVRPLFVQARSAPPPSALVVACTRAGLSVVTWSGAPTAAGLGAALAPGAIIKLPVDAATIAALPGVAALLEQAGYTPVTVAELVAVSEGAQGLVMPATP